MKYSNDDNLLINILKDFLKNLSNNEPMFIFQGIENLVEKAKEFHKTIKEYNDGSLINFLKIAWNYEEKFQESYDLEDAVRWFKSNHPGEGYIRCIIVEKEPKDMPQIISLHHCFIESKRENPILDGSLPHRAVRTLYLTDRLKEAFGDKDMIILK